MAARGAYSYGDMFRGYIRLDSAYVTIYTVRNKLICSMESIGHKTSGYKLREVWLRAPNLAPPDPLHGIGTLG